MNKGIKIHCLQWVPPEKLQLMTWVFVLKPVISVINHEIHRATRVDQLLLLGMVILPLYLGILMMDI